MQKLCLLPQVLSLQFSPVDEDVIQHIPSSVRTLDVMDPWGYDFQHLVNLEKLIISQVVSGGLKIETSGIPTTVKDLSLSTWIDGDCDLSHLVNLESLHIFTFFSLDGVLKLSPDMPLKRLELNNVTLRSIVGVPSRIEEIILTTTEIKHDRVSYGRAIIHFERLI